MILKHKCGYSEVSLNSTALMAMKRVGAQFENSNEIGVFSRLTNFYCHVAIGGSEKTFTRFSKATSILSTKKRDG